MSMPSVGWRAGWLGEATVVGGASPRCRAVASAGEVVVGGEGGCASPRRRAGASPPSPPPPRRRRVPAAMGDGAACALRTHAHAHATHAQAHARACLARGGAFLMKNCDSEGIEKKTLAPIHFPIFH